MTGIFSAKRTRLDWYMSTSLGFLHPNQFCFIYLAIPILKRIYNIKQE